MPDVPTQRELEALSAWVLLGGAKAAAYELGISEHTVKNLLTTLRIRVGAVSTAQAFAICVKRGLLTKHGSPDPAGKRG